ncbi:MAG: Ig-like domain-containing protein [Chloroflexi bacterium]|nr:Ig-like domain-containing protein [Chloroflexota bacterium]
MKSVKNRLTVVLYPALALVALLLLVVLPASAAPPGLPHSFSGTVTIGGADAPTATVVSARSGGVEIASVTTTVPGQYSSLLVTGLTDDDTIAFFLDGVDTTQTFTFESGATTTLNLVVTAPDTTDPTVTISSTATSPTNTSPIPVTATFDETVTGFDISDLNVGNGAAGSFVAVSGTVYTFDVTPTADGAVTVDIAAGVAQDPSGNNNTAAAQFSITFDTTAPTVTITSTAGSSTNTTPIPVKATFNETVTGFDAGDIVVGNGSAGSFVAVSGTEYTFDVTPTVDGEVTVDIASGVATDAAGNGNAVATQFTITFATAAASIDTVSSPTNSSTQTLTGVRTDGISVALSADTAAAFGTITFPSGTTWTAVVSGLVEGPNVITVTAESGTSTATIVFDTVLPTVSSISPASGATGVAVNTDITVTFSEAMDPSTITTSSFTVTGDSVTGVVSYDSSTKTATFNPSPDLATGTTFTAALSTAVTDAAGNALASAFSWSFTTVAGSLSDEVDLVPSGGTVTLSSGTFSGNLVITKPITITGSTTGEPTVISGGITIEAVSGSNVTVENLTITDYTDFGLKLVKVSAVDTFIIRNNIFQGDSGSIVGIQVDEVEAGGSLTIQNNSILNNVTGIKLEAAVTAATIDFNDITGNTTAGLELVAGGGATAEKNWWGDISGPKQTTTNPRGAGDAVSGSADYQPWLTRQFATVQADNISYFGNAWVSLSSGWNIMSTPIALDAGADTWGEYVALGSPGLRIHDTNPAFSYDAATGVFVALTDSFQLKATDAIYVRMSQADIAPVLYSPGTSVPSKPLSAGWNLIGLGNLVDMTVTDALTSVFTVSGDLTGYSQVVSPSIGNQAAWVFIRGGTSQTMVKTKGYWVFMINAPTGTALAGFTFTPIVLP